MTKKKSLLVSDFFIIHSNKMQFQETVISTDIISIMCLLSSFQVIPYVGEETAPVRAEACSPAVIQERQEVLEVCFIHHYLWTYYYTAVYTYKICLFIWVKKHPYKHGQRVGIYFKETYIIFRCGFVFEKVFLMLS